MPDGMDAKAHSGLERCGLVGRPKPSGEFGIVVGAHLATDPALFES